MNNNQQDWTYIFHYDYEYQSLDTLPVLIEVGSKLSFSGLQFIVDSYELSEGEILVHCYQIGNIDYDSLLKQLERERQLKILNIC